MTKKVALIVAAAMMAGLTGCGNGEVTQTAGTTQEAQAQASAAQTTTTEQTQPAGEPAEVVWWTYFGDTNIGYLQNVIDAFNESQQDYHVTIEYQGKQSEMNAKIQSTAQEDLPALFSGAVENVAMYANADYCADLQQFIDKDTEGWKELDDTWDAIRSAYCDNEGNQVGYPIGYSYPGVYYNADMFKEAGIDLASVKSYSDLYEVSKKLVDGGYTKYGIGFHADGFYFNAALGREGLQAYDNNNGLGADAITKCLYTSDEKVDAAITNMLGVYQKLHAESLCVPYGSDYQAEIIPQLASGDCAMMMGVVSMTTKVLRSEERR